jgi:flagellar biosynthesis protein FlhF
MKIKEFEALTLKDCLNRVRQELGPEAVILETRKCRKGGVMGLGTHEAVRIVAATGITVNDERERMRDSAVPTHRPSSSNHDTAALEKIARLEREVQELQQGIAIVQHAVLTTPSSAPAAESPKTPFPELEQKLIRADVSETLAAELLESLPDLSAWGPQARSALAEAALRERMAQHIASAGPITLTPGECKTVALIGPTGVGKTTTIAKLAAHFALVEKRRVALLTMDTYRIAAIEQLKTYSQIIDIPIKVAYNQAEILPALEAFRHHDLVLIDTAGRSQKNSLQVNELKSLVEAAGCETHLALSASTKRRDLDDQLERFSCVGVNRLLFTKLDETTTYGTIYSIAAQSDVPVSYITTGQKVPEDIEPADGTKLAAIVMNSLPGGQHITVSRP